MKAVKLSGPEFKKKYNSLCSSDVPGRGILKIKLWSNDTFKA